MIKLRSFPFDKTGEANEFLIDHTPFTTEKGSGIAYTPTHIMITYDDGIFNYNNIVNKFKSLIGKEIEMIELNKHQIKKNNYYLKELAPKGYKKNLTDKELFELCKAEEGENGYKKAKERTNSIAELENNNLMCSHTVMNSMREIELYEETIKSYATNNKESKD